MCCDAAADFTTIVDSLFFLQFVVIADYSFFFVLEFVILTAICVCVVVCCVDAI